MKTTRRLVATTFLTLAFAMLAAGPALAHGEQSQEPWLRMNTVGFWNTEFTANGETVEANVGNEERIPLQVGDEVTLTGTARVLETWPRTLRGPDTAFISVVSPGPVFIMTERTVNGLPAPHSLYIRKGGTYNYEMTLRARIPGDYHLHPTLAVRGSGTLIGPGQWFNVTGDRSAFRNDVELADGTTVNLENYGLIWRELFSWATMVLGVIWLLYWIVPKPTVTRLAVTSQLSVNDDGGEAVGLITRKDHRAMNLILLATVALLAIGWIYQSVTWPNKIPLQVDRYAAESAPLPPDIIRDVVARDALYDEAAGTVTFTMIGSTTGGPVEVGALHLADFTFTAGDAPTGTSLVAEPAQISGENQEFTITISSETLDNHLLLPRDSPNTSMAGVVRFDAPGAESNFKTFQQNLRFQFAF
jgi:methane/ammonia monooxygenase subunit B